MRTHRPKRQAREQKETHTQTAHAHSTDEGTGRAYAYMLASSLSFALMGAFSHAAGERCDWHLVAFARSLLAFLLTLALSNTVPVWVTLLAWPVLGQRPRAAVWGAITIGLAGVVLIQRPESASDRVACALALGNALSTSVSMLGLNRLGGVDARAVVTHFSGVATVFTLAFMLLSGGRVDYGALRDTTTLALLLGVGVAATAGQLTMTKAFASAASPSKVSVVGLMQIVFALLFDLLLWHRHFDALVVLGIALVVGPSAWLMLRNPFRRQTPIHTTG